MKLLLVEDDIEISQMLKDYLKAENYEVICAADGEEACEKYDSDSYSLVLLDLMIPKISGMEVMGKGESLGVRGVLRKSHNRPLPLVLQYRA